LSLAAGVKATGVAEFIERGVGGLHGLPRRILVLLITATPQMGKAGLWLKLLGIALVVMLLYGVVIHVLGIEAAF
jgi:hypothetical protein